MDISTDDSRDMAAANQQRSDRITGDNGGEDHILLRPPIIEATGKLATGATTPMLQKQKKIHHNERLSEQPVASQWQLHTGATLIPQEHLDQWTKTSALREMAPQGGNTLGAQRQPAGIGLLRKSKRRSTGAHTNWPANQTPLHTSHKRSPTRSQRDKHGSSSGRTSKPTTHGTSRSCLWLRFHTSPGHSTAQSSTYLLCYGLQTAT